MPRNPFEEFDQISEPTSLSPENGVSKPTNGLLSQSKHPFAEFAEDVREERTIPMDEILASHASAMGRLTEAYGALIAECVGDGIWQADRKSIGMTYDTACRIVGETDWEMADVEVFCAHALQSNDPAFFVMDPLGLFLSAFCNASSQPELRLDLSGQDLRLSLMGYQLREGLTLTIVGDLGDLTGISLNGGFLKIHGDVRHYLGAGMAAGHVEVTGDAGRFVGEQMAGGEIHIGGRLGGVGNPQGGIICHRKQVIYGEIA